MIASAVTLTLAATAASAAVLSYSETTGGFRSPARGWNSFGLQANNINGDFSFDQAHVTAQCDLLASQLAGANYTLTLYDASKFDVPALAEHLHAHGLQLGLYVVPGALRTEVNKTILGTGTRIGDVCTGDEGLARCVFDYTRPEVQTCHDSVVQQFAEWGADMIKLDYVTPGSPDNGQHLPSDQSAALDRSPACFRVWNAHADGMRTDQDISNSGETKLLAWATAKRAVDNYRQWIVAVGGIFTKDEAAAGAPGPGQPARGQ
ncbi:glycoside hydrolase family 27 [Cordyceps fumosorosea ARSEF 2679]|uniref:alpha-galactosidase n=1 Tax=Cordyceps fumosorosea (strain ARSEF 2679) TaxID=1081104 RepID=A0A167NKC4_CORFA|nr:glycoside hydrolase family 27 [Cordyceps fumosorosea ARSEF 2679]OAA55646.1 glycoside hydrolase family 27 [Cordyceps fumosorosea ARSEF 2679]